MINCLNTRFDNNSTDGEQITNRSGIQNRAWPIPVEIVVIISPPVIGSLIAADEVLADGSISSAVIESIPTATQAAINELNNAGATVYKFIDKHGSEVACWTLAPGVCVTSTAIDELTGFDLWDEVVLELAQFAVSPLSLALCVQLADIYAKSVRLNDITTQWATGTGAVTNYRNRTKEYRKFAIDHVNGIKIIPIINSILLN